MRRVQTLVVLAAVSLAALLPAELAGAAPARGTTGPAAAQARIPVAVTMGDFWFKLSRNSVPRGSTVVFNVVNRGDLGHDMVFGALNKKTRVLDRGERQRLIVTFNKRGRFQYICAVGEHFFRGMRGVFRVR